MRIAVKIVVVEVTESSFLLLAFNAKMQAWRPSVRPCSGPSSFQGDVDKLSRSHKTELQSLRERQIELELCTQDVLSLKVWLQRDYVRRLLLA